MSFAVRFAVSLAPFLFAMGVSGSPIPDEGPHKANGWGQVVRLRHLYAARHGVHLLINGDGRVHGSADQTPYSLMEIRPVDRGCVVIRGIAASQFLCTEGSGRLYSSHTYTRDDCTFREQILPDGYNVYISDKHGTPVSLGGHRQRLQGRDLGLPALAQFLPRISALGLGVAGGLESKDQPDSQISTRYWAPDAADDMDLLGKASQIIHSPSFQER